MSDIIVDAGQRMLRHGMQNISCLIGQGGTIASDAKREGDGATPIGRWPVRAVLLRPDRGLTLPRIALPWRWLRPRDGWSDDGRDPTYNRPILHPHPFSAEELWRQDGLYDIIVTLGHNDAPPVPGAGSAIFLHCTAERDYTRGCVAIARDALLGLIGTLKPGDALIVTP